MSRRAFPSGVVARITRTESPPRTNSQIVSTRPVISRGWASLSDGEARRQRIRRNTAVFQLVRQAGVERAPRQQLLVGPLRDNAAAIEDEDAIRRADGGQAVRDDERRTSLLQPAEAVEHE